MSGIELIAAERQRQIEKEGWSPQHDDQHENSELVKAAISYAIAGIYPEGTDGAKAMLDRVKYHWPNEWSWKWWKPKDRVRNLVRAGALIAAEIDRLEREAG